MDPNKRSKETVPEDGSWKIPGAYLQFEKYVENSPTMKPRHQIRCKNFSSYVLVHNNAALYEDKAHFDVMSQLRDAKIHIRLVKESASQSIDGLPMGYLALLDVPDLDRDARRIVSKADKFQIVFHPRSETDSVCLADRIDSSQDVPGWNARVRLDPMYHSGRSVLVWLMRPKDSTHPDYALDLHATKIGDSVPAVVNGYIRYTGSSITLKEELEAIGYLRGAPDHIREFARKWDFLYNRFSGIERRVDLLQGLSESQVKTVTEDLTPSQASAFTVYLRSLRNGIGLIRGSVGSGKTHLILCLARAFNFSNKRLLVIATSNSALGSVTKKLVEQQDLLAVRVYPTHLEGLEGSVALTSLVKPRSADDGCKEISSDHEGRQCSSDIARTEQNMQCELLMFRTAEKAMEEIADVKIITDEMRLIGASLHARILQLTGVSPIIFAKAEWVFKCKQTGKRLINAHIETFQELYKKAKVQALDQPEDGRWKKASQYLMIRVMQSANVIVTTPIHAASTRLMDVEVNAIVLDEANYAPESEVLAGWLNSPSSDSYLYKPFVMIGDCKQLPPPVISTHDENKYRSCREHSFFERFSQILQHAVIKETMRMTKGLELLCSDLFYKGQLELGPGTSLQDPARRVSLALKTFLNNKYPVLEGEPEDSIYPVHLNVFGECEVRQKDNSRFNKTNVAITLDIIRQIIDKGIVAAQDIGIITSYSAQADLYEMVQIHENISPMADVGTVECYQNREKKLMICDFVRTFNDGGLVGADYKKRHLNVMLSRPSMGLIIVGDAGCFSLNAKDTEAYIAFMETVQKARDNKESHTPQSSGELYRAIFTNKSAALESVFKWFRDHKRVVEICQEEVPYERYFGNGWDALQADPLVTRRSAEDNDHIIERSDLTAPTNESSKEKAEINILKQ